MQGSCCRVGHVIYLWFMLSCWHSLALSFGACTWFYWKAYIHDFLQLQQRVITCAYILLLSVLVHALINLILLENINQWFFVVIWYITNSEARIVCSGLQPVGLTVCNIPPSLQGDGVFRPSRIQGFNFYQGANIIWILLTRSRGTSVLVHYYHDNMWKSVSIAIL